MISKEHHCNGGDGRSSPGAEKRLGADSARELPLAEGECGPEAFPRRVLLAVTGLSPQVVTETVYALTQKIHPPFVPTELHLLSTAQGAEHARLELLSEDRGWFRRLCVDYGLPRIDFGEHTIHVLAAADENPMADIRTRAENERLADLLIETIRALTSDPDCALHVSIAGGRKTMGFYAGYALSLLGRPQDRLSHVLVSEYYESNHDFYYPTPYPKVIHKADKGPLDTSKAEVELADIPFVRLRGGLDERLLGGSVTFSEVVAAAQRSLEPALLEIDLDRKCIIAGGEEMHLPPAQLAFLSWLARRAKTGRPEVECPPSPRKRIVPNPEYAQEYLLEYRHVADDVDSLTATRLRHGMDKAFFEQNRSKLHSAIRARLGPDGVRRYGILGDGRRPRQQYRIGVPAENIRWVGWVVAGRSGKLADRSPEERTRL
jgi:CRISPR-associated protein (TIGR02584 family)